MSTVQSILGTRTFEYAQVDVFAENPFEGNMLGIFPDARGLSDLEMQALARETNLSETTFILPREPDVERERGVQVRIFTVQEELPFAGHPTLGTASWLHWNHGTLRGQEEIVLDLKGGRVPVRFDTSDSRPGVVGIMQQPQPIFGEFHDPAAVTQAIGMTLDDLDPELPVQTVSTGLPYCIVPLKSVAVAGRLKIAQDAAQVYLDRTDAKWFYCLAPVIGGNAHFHARMQFYNGEDPATGSASGCAIAYLVRHGVVPGGKQVVIEQGIEMLRPSRIEVRAIKRPQEDLMMDVFVGGRTIPVASGRFFLR